MAKKHKEEYFYDFDELFPSGDLDNLTRVLLERIEGWRDKGVVMVQFRKDYDAQWLLLTKERDETPAEVAARERAEAKRLQAKAEARARRVAALEKQLAKLKGEDP